MRLTREHIKKMNEALDIAPNATFDVKETPKGQISIGVVQIKETVEPISKIVKNNKTTQPQVASTS